MVREENSEPTDLRDCSDRVHKAKAQKWDPQLFPNYFALRIFNFNSVSETQCEKAIFSKVVLKTLL